MVKELEIAIKGFFTEYDRYPFEDKPDGRVQPAPAQGALLECLLGQNAASNPRAIQFLNPSPAKEGKGGLYTDRQGNPTLRDNYGNPLMVIIDYERTGEIPDPSMVNSEEPDTLSNGILIYTAGKDHDLSTWEDNVTSWR